MNPFVKRSNQGFSLPELMVAIAVSSLVVIIAGEALLSQVRTSNRMEGLERQRSDWSRSTFFMDAEVALSQEVFTGADLQALSLPSACSGISPANLKFALRIRPDLPLVFYGLENSMVPWLPVKSLYRCGPEIDAEGSYIADTLSLNLLVDGLDTNGFMITSSQRMPPNLQYTLSLRGNAQSSYSQQTGTNGRAVPAYIRPDLGKICTATTAPTGSIGVICNGANGDATTNNIIEDFAGTDRVYDGVGGNNRLVGTSGADTLSAGGGDDVFLGFGGNDTLNGGSGYNRYVPDAGNDIINGGNGVDAVFFTGNKSLFSLSSCNKSSCTVSSSTEGTDTLKQVDVLVFDDQVQFLN
jgi:prepilin-type N-terminal cleavage/methylation domain-containing protein